MEWEFIHKVAVFINVIRCLLRLSFQLLKEFSPCSTIYNNQDTETTCVPPQMNGERIYGVCVYIYTHTYIHIVGYHYLENHITDWSFPDCSVVKNPPAKQETWVQFLSQEDPLEKEMTTLSSILAWKITCTEEPGGLQSMGSQKSQTWLSN